MKSFAPDIRTLVTSGYQLDEVKRSFFSEGPVDFIMKPFNAEDLIKKVQELLSIDSVQDSHIKKDVAPLKNRFDTY